MAFNPMANFQKYKKIWMASIILLCMVVFVLCSGVGGGSRDEGGLGGLVRGWFRSKGPILVEVDGSNYYKEDFELLKENREIGNKFMRYFLDTCAQKVEDLLKNPDGFKDYVPAERKVAKSVDQGALMLAYAAFKEKLKRGRYFEGSYKVNDLATFQAWLNEADGMGIELTDKMVTAMIIEEGGVFLPHTEKDPIRVPLVGTEDFGRISRRVRAEGGSREVSDARVARALRDELRVLIAKMVWSLSPPSETEMRLPGFKHQQALTPRVLLTPEQIGQIYRKYRTTFDLTLVPVSAEDWARQVTVHPLEKFLAPFAALEPFFGGYQTVVEKLQDQVLEPFFNEYKNVVEDPASDKTGLKYPPNRYTVHLLMADPKSDHFRGKAQAKLALELTPPVAWNPMMPPLMTYLNFPLTDELRGYVIEKRINTERSTTRVREIFGAGRTGDESYAAYLLAWLGRHDPQGQASLANMVALGLGEATPLYAAIPLFVQQALKEDAGGKKDKEKGLPGWNKEELFRAELARQAEVERKERAPVFATALSLASDPWTALAPAIALSEPFLETWEQEPSMEEKFIAQQFKRPAPAPTPIPPWTTQERKIPLKLYLQEEWDKLVHEVATGYARESMMEARDQVANLGGDKGRLEPRLRNLVKHSKLTLIPSKRPYTQAEMEKAKELEPLRKAFEEHARTIDLFEGRRGDKKLEGKPFAQALFFTAGEKHSVAGQPFVPKEWPPKLDVAQVPEVVKQVHDYLTKDLPLSVEVELKLEYGDPLAGKGESVSLFDKVDNPLLFWREDAPKEEPLRWVTKIQENLKTKLADLKDPEEEKKAIKKAENEIREVRERTLEAYKLHKARTELIPEAARELAMDLAKDGGSTVGLGGPYREALNKAKAQELRKGHPLIELPQVAPWYQVKKGLASLDYQDFTLPREVAYPPEGMAKKLLTVPTLDKAFETGHAETDALNKDLYSLSKEAFKRLKTAPVPTNDRDPRIVQIIPNRPRSVYYIVLLTDNTTTPFDIFEGAEGRMAGFLNALAGQYIVGDERQWRIDPFLTKVYEEAGREWQKKVTEGLWKRHKVEVKDTQEAKGFEADAGG